MHAPFNALAPRHRANESSQSVSKSQSRNVKKKKKNHSTRITVSRVKDTVNQFFAQNLPPGGEKGEKRGPPGESYASGDPAPIVGAL